MKSSGKVRRHFFLHSVAVLLAVFAFVVTTTISIVNPPVTIAKEKGKSEDKKIEVIFTTWTTSKGDLGLWLNWYFDQIEKRTNGRVKFNRHFGGTLFSHKDAMDAVINGLADCFTIVPHRESARLPLYNVSTLPGMVLDTRVATVAAHKYGNTELVQKEFEKLGLRFITGVAADLMYLFGNKPLKSLDDLKGYTVNVGGQAAKVAIQLGASAINTPSAESYEALKRGTCDFIWYPRQAMSVWSIEEVVKYYFRRGTNAGARNFPIIMNLNKWNSLPKDIQETITTFSEEQSYDYAERWMDNGPALKGHEQRWRDMGMKIIDFSQEEQDRFVRLLMEADQEYINKKEEAGVPAKEGKELFLKIVKEVQGR